MSKTVKDNFKMLFLFAEDNTDIIPSYYKIIGETKSTYKIKLIFTDVYGFILENTDEVDFYSTRREFFYGINRKTETEFNYAQKTTKKTINKDSKYIKFMLDTEDYNYTRYNIMVYSCKSTNTNIVSISDSYSNCIKTGGDYLADCIKDDTKTIYKYDMDLYANYGNPNFTVGEFNNAILYTQQTRNKSREGYLKQLLRYYPRKKAETILNKIIEGGEV